LTVVPFHSKKHLQHLGVQKRQHFKANGLTRKKYLGEKNQSLILISNRPQNKEHYDEKLSHVLQGSEKM